jgi:hypothetical protein
MIEHTDRPELTVYLRASTPSVARERQQEVVERAERLAETDRIEDVTVRRWDDRVVVSNGPDTTDAHALEAFESFKRHTEESGRSVEPFFQEHERPDGRLIVFPMICIAVHADDDLLEVFPCADDDRSAVYSVWDCLTALETDGEVVALTD